MSCSSSSEDPDYMIKLKSRIRRHFLTYIKPGNVLPYFQHYGPHILVQADTDLVKAVRDSRGDHDAADVLLDRISLYKDWFQCTLQVLRDPEVKLGHIAEVLERKKEELDKNKEQEEKKHEKQMKKLEEQLRQKDEQILHLQAAREQGADQTRSVQNNNKRKLTWKVATELEKVERIIEEERKRHKKELAQRDQVISKLKQEKEIITKERDHTIEKQEAEREAQALTSLQLVFSPSRSGGVSVFNYFMTSWMQRDYPDIARKYCISRCDVPPDLKDAVDWMEKVQLHFGNDELDEMKMDDLPIMKNKMTNFLQAMQDKANRRRDNNCDEDNRKFYLLCYIVLFFTCCSVYFSRLKTRGVKEMSEFLLHCRDSIFEIIDPLVDELGGWADVLPEDCLLSSGESWIRRNEMD